MAWPVKRPTGRASRPLRAHSTAHCQREVMLTHEHEVTPGRRVGRARSEGYRWEAHHKHGGGSSGLRSGVAMLKPPEARALSRTAGTKDSGVRTDEVFGALGCNWAGKGGDLRDAFSKSSVSFGEREAVQGIAPSTAAVESDHCGSCKVCVYGAAAMPSIIEGIDSQSGEASGFHDGAEGGCFHSVCVTQRSAARTGTVSCCVKGAARTEDDVARSGKRWDDNRAVCVSSTPKWWMSS
ncbi:hypothetical protein B0H11DRAFT_1934890 [Mycena galericulata]|nr:hypothetical protein B0H11DRAFT_1934890 [Mycena galericulata]